MYTIGDVKASLPIKTDTNLHLHQERSQPDPIMLLAAAAAVIDDEGKYKGRSYERREIRLYGRHGKIQGHLVWLPYTAESNVFVRYDEKKVIYIWVE